MLDTDLITKNADDNGGFTGINASRLFTASCFALVTTAFAFAIRAGILSKLATQFGLSNTQLGYINQMAILGFPIATMVGGWLYNEFGPKRMMGLAFGTHLVGILMTIFAGDFWTLLFSNFLVGFGNGTVEAACNPLISNMYKNNLTTMLNRFHVWFPGGIFLGALISQFMGGMAWQAQIAVMLVPLLIYGYLFMGQKFPSAAAAGQASTASNIQGILSPLYLFMVFCMILTANTELSTQQWVERLLGQAGGAQPMLILALVTGLMAVGRYFAGPVIHRLNPTGVLWGSAIIALIGIYLMSSATGGMTYVAAILFAIGVCYFWPTMLGFVGENIPKSGALGMSLIGGGGMFGVSITQPIVGGWLDSAREMAKASAATPEAADLAAGQATLLHLCVFPAILSVAFGLLWFYMRGRK
jgi:MFS transporter, putative metabolite:H+ symporter